MFQKLPSLKLPVFHLVFCRIYLDTFSPLHWDQSQFVECTFPPNFCYFPPRRCHVGWCISPAGGYCRLIHGICNTHFITYQRILSKHEIWPRDRTREVHFSWCGVVYLRNWTVVNVPLLPSTFVGLFKLIMDSLQSSRKEKKRIMEMEIFNDSLECISNWKGKI